MCVSPTFLKFFIFSLSKNFYSYSSRKRLYNKETILYSHFRKMVPSLYLTIFRRALFSHLLPTCSPASSPCKYRIILHSKAIDVIFSISQHLPLYAIITKTKIVTIMYTISHSYLHPTYYLL